MYDVPLQKTLCHITMQMAVYWWNDSCWKFVFFHDIWSQCGHLVSCMTILF